MGTKSTFILLFICLIGHISWAQKMDKCAFNNVSQKIISSYPAFADTLAKVKGNKSYTGRSSRKTTATNAVIPVVFHIVLNESQLQTVGGEEGIKRRIDSQLIVVNRDFAAQNPDISNVPDAFKPLVGTSSISFGLARTAPDGSATVGYNIVITSRIGFNVEGGNGSGFGFSGAKYDGLGASAWDPQSYLNIWVINPLEDGGESNILGLALPPYFTREGTGIPIAERGVVINYRAFGKRSAISDVYISGADQGRTLTHELGHFFELFHIWGDDDGKCSFNGGADDGIDDTPGQAHPSRNCPSFPKYDNCSRSDAGIMFMNYMDYTDDRCVNMFTKGQTSKMHMSVSIGGDAFSLTQHPWLLELPNIASNAAKEEVRIYPNPADNLLNIVFRLPVSDLQYISLTDLTGRVVAQQEYSMQTAYYSFSTTGLHAGCYVLVMERTSGKVFKKIIVR